MILLFFYFLVIGDNVLLELENLGDNILLELGVKNFVYRLINNIQE